MSLLIYGILFKLNLLYHEMMKKEKEKISDDYLIMT